MNFDDLDPDSQQCDTKYGKFEAGNVICLFLVSSALEESGGEEPEDQDEEESSKSSDDNTSTYSSELSESSYDSCPLARWTASGGSPPSRSKLSKHKSAGVCKSRLHKYKRVKYPGSSEGLFLYTMPKASQGET